ncbi:hypothetical protein [Mesorhizobium sp. SP-1A]|uniref:hypothetical protein n=1 Tax=Mesorhizobium sp. SP-1A TaxID=3077840 RepID=UPI0028F73DF4|nr:hypothetical protein [Mesorhizobium sp. SP-1A]
MKTISRKTGIIGAFIVFGAGVFLGSKWGGMEEARAHRDKIESELWVQRQMDYIFSGVDKCHIYVDDKKRREAENARNDIENTKVRPRT